jgi:hypothetical protein
VARAGLVALTLSLAALVAAARPAPGEEPRTLVVWMGPGLQCGRGAGGFGAANPDWGVGPGFSVTLHRAGVPFGARVDAGFATLGGPPGDVVFDDGVGLVPGRIETSTRVSWALAGVQWQRPAGEAAAFANLLVGLGGTRTEAATLEGLAFDPSGRPESHRGFAWGGGVGLRKRLRAGSNAAGAIEIAYRGLPGVDYVDAPPFDSDASGSRYRVAHGALHAVVAQLAITFTRK